MDDSEDAVLVGLAQIEDSAAGLRGSLGRLRSAVQAVMGSPPVRMWLADDGSVERVQFRPGFLRTANVQAIDAALELALVDATLAAFENGSMRAGEGSSGMDASEGVVTDEARRVTIRVVGGRLAGIECRDGWVQRVADAAVADAICRASRRALGVEDDGAVGWTNGIAVRGLP